MMYPFTYIDHTFDHFGVDKCTLFLAVIHMLLVSWLLALMGTVTPSQIWAFVGKDSLFKAASNWQQEKNDITAFFWVRPLTDGLPPVMTGTVDIKWFLFAQFKAGAE